MRTATVYYTSHPYTNEPIYMIWLLNGAVSTLRGYRGSRKQFIHILRDYGFTGTLIFPHGKRKVTIK